MKEKLKQPADLKMMWKQKMCWITQRSLFNDVFFDANEYNLRILLDLWIPFKGWIQAQV